jgi:hypothetical protein
MSGIADVNMVTLATATYNIQGFEVVMAKSTTNRKSSGIKRRWFLFLFWRSLSAGPVNSVPNRHCTHALQGLDVVCFARMKVIWKEEINQFEELHRRKVGKADFTELSGRAYFRAFTGRQGI